LTLSLLLDVVSTCLAAVNKTDFEPFNEKLRTEAGRNALKERIKARRWKATRRRGER
jgi:hypothetical protein